MRKKISITVNEDVIREIDRRRGLVSRSRFVEEILKKGLRHN